MSLESIAVRGKRRMLRRGSTIQTCTVREDIDPESTQFANNQNQSSNSKNHSIDEVQNSNSADYMLLHSGRRSWCRREDPVGRALCNDMFV